MAVELDIDQPERMVHVRVTGTLTRDDYAVFVPQLERQIEQHGKVRILFEMHDFHGWSAGALWEDVKFDAKHFRDIERLAVIGETRWQKGMTAFCRPFTTAAIRYFEHAQLDQARAWLRED